MLVFGTVTSIVTARWLGPSAKGTLSALFFLGDAFFFYLCSLGLDEAAIILVARGEATLQEALERSILPLAIASCLGAMGLFIVAVPANWSGILDAVAIECVILVGTVFLGFFSSILNARERFLTTSFLTLLRGVGVALASIIFVAVLDLGIPGGALGSAVGVLVALGFGVVAVRREGLYLRVRRSFRYVRSALRFGVPLQLSYLLIAMTQRFDQLIVYQVAGESAGGHYAIALTLGQLGGYAAFALSLTSFPRVAFATPEEVVSLIAKVCRTGVAAAIAGGVVLALTIPVATRFLYGDAYRNSVVPAEILTFGAILWSAQWILARGAAARGTTWLVLASFASNLVVMVLGAYLVVPLWGVSGAALASTVGSLVGLAICLYVYVVRWGVPIRRLTPTTADFIYLWRFLASIGRQLRGLLAAG